MECSIEGCANQMKYGKTGWCQTHYHRWWRTGTTDLLERRPDRSTFSYRTAHNWVVYEWGLARQYPCVACGDWAKEWAYDGTDPSEKSEMMAGRYPVQFSVWPEFYMPMCFPCHRLMDSSARFAKRTHFNQCGHPRSPENTYIPPGKKAAECKICRSARSRARYLERKRSA